MYDSELHWRRREGNVTLADGAAQDRVHFSRQQAHPAIGSDGSAQDRIYKVDDATVHDLY
jgi:hypothetical protein